MGVLLLLLLLQAEPQTPAAQPQQPPPPDPHHKYEPISGNDPNDLHKRQNAEFMQRIAIVHGRVASAAGGTLPSPAYVEAICAGSYQQGMFAKDEFDLAISSGSSPLTGGSAGGACSLRVSLSGYHTVVVPVAGGGTQVDVGLIILRPREGVTGFTYSATTLFAPPKARKAFEKGFALAGKRKWKEARKELETAVGEFPKFSAAWCELGDVLNRLGLVAEARDAYRRSSQTDSKFLRPALHLAMLEAGQRNWKESAILTDQVIAQNPHDYPEAFLYNAAALYNLGLRDQAEQAVLRAIELDTAHVFPKSYQLLAAIQAERGDRTRAIENLKLYLRYGPPAAEAENARRQIEEFEKLPATPARN